MRKIHGTLGIQVGVIFIFLSACTPSAPPNSSASVTYNGAFVTYHPIEVCDVFTGKRAPIQRPSATAVASDFTPDQVGAFLRIYGHSSGSCDTLYSDVENRRIENAEGARREEQRRIAREEMFARNAASASNRQNNGSTINQDGNVANRSRAHSVCERRAQQAGGAAARSTRPTAMQTTTTCRPGPFGQYNCSSQDSLTGGAWGGMLTGLERSRASRNAAQSEYDFCMLQLGFEP